MAKLNFVIVTEYTIDNKKYYLAHTSYEYENCNLLFYFESIKKAKTNGKPIIIQYCSSAKKANELASQWNDSYKQNGTRVDLNYVVYGKKLKGN